ncbi:DUF6265 family protein [Pedobacter xixiisoli]|uniref:DUF6265 domain-containing protein n=1 Tax=Pedobacter xixiisoli TaxID=1476464 RepID=A0A286ADM5_9SPHI|nr:DUF6265 family protein [Pedobacter xixiisoli]SOD20001.1 hypothetical protein SAMN06297358_3709 [Pedobacter xixiisoli]
MKKSLSIAILIIASLYASAQKPTLKTFDFIIGKWEMKTKTGKIVERWQKHRDSLTGTSHRFNAKGDSVLTESVVLKKIKGDWHYCVTGYEKGNEGRTDFKLATSANNTFTFENKQHDFPQQIVYQNKGKDNLLAWIEGEIGGKKRKMEFPYQRAK